MAAEVLFEKLVQLIKSESDLIGAVLRDDPRKIFNNIDNLKDFMKKYSEVNGDGDEKYSEVNGDGDEKYSEVNGDGDEKYPEVNGDGDNNNIAKLLATNIRDEVVSGTEDILEIFKEKATIYRGGRFGKRIPDAVADLALEVRASVKNIETVTEMVQKFYQNKEELDIESLKAQLPRRSAIRHNTADLMAEEDMMVGFQDELKAVIELLCLGSDQLEVVSITGKSGLGKTKLAKKVYNHPVIENKFSIRNFITVSREYSRKDVFSKLLKNLGSMEEIERMSEDELSEIVRDYLETRKYLVILDDVREIIDIKEAFPNNQKRSRILITSQDNVVAGKANRYCIQYSLRPLNTDEKQELLRRKVFGENYCPQEMEEYELQILSKCNGFPLVLLLVAGILLNDRDEIKWWKKVAKLLNDQLVVAIDPQRIAIDVLSLSYNQLPDHLKQCFLYLGTFPEYFQIPVRRLLRLWTAEGFVQQEENLRLEDVGYGYLEDLIYRNLVMVGRKCSTGKTNTCHIHPMISKFCKEHGATKNLFKEIKSSETAFRLNNCHRLCINSHLFDFLSQGSSNMPILSFLSFVRGRSEISHDKASSFGKSFKLVRVFDASPIMFPRFPSEFLNLVLLKYLTISGHFKVLPKSLTCLNNLQTLVVETSFRALEIQASILTMAHLRYFRANVPSYLKAAEPVAESFINTSLQSLSPISPETGKKLKALLQRTPNLITLGLSGELFTVLNKNIEDNPWFDDSISKSGIQNLKLLNESSRSLYVLPPQSLFPRKLTKLTLSNTMLRWSAMEILGELKILEVLKLKDNAIIGPIWQTKDGGFRRLKILHIHHPDWVFWKASASHFPMLMSLFLRHCTSLQDIPIDFHTIPRFQKIDLYCCSPEVAVSARKHRMLKLQKNIKFQLSIFPPDQ